MSVFIPAAAHPKSAQILCLAFGVTFHDCWIPARRTQYCVPVVQELCYGLKLAPAEVYDVAWIFRNWLGDFSGMNIPKAYLPKERPVMSAGAVASESDAAAMQDVLEAHMRQCERCGVATVFWGLFA